MATACPPGWPGGVEFLTANGSRDSHATTLADGLPNRSSRAGQAYDRIGWQGILELAAKPATTPKDRARLVILSTYAEADGRTHAVQRERGRYGGLAVDIDRGNPSIDEVATAVQAAIGTARAVIYSSASARADARKWRVLVPLAELLPGADYPDTQAALFDLLEAAGLVCDAALARAGQPVFLPNVPRDKRGEDGLPVFYQWRELPGPVLELVPDHPIAARREAMRARLAELQAAEAARATQYQARRLAHVQATGDDFEPIAHFNDHHTVAEMLQRYGFTRRDGGRGSHWRSPLSTSGGYSTQDRGGHWVTVSSWAEVHDVGRVSRSGNRYGDAFDLFAYFEHAGDRSAAVAAYAAEVRPRRAHQPDAPPAPRAEVITTVAEVPVDVIRGTVAEQLAGVLEARPPLAVLTAGTAASKTTTAVRLGAEQPGRVFWNVASHAAAEAVLAMHQAAGHDDAAAMPPRDETTCACWTAEDAGRVAAAHGVRPGPAMERALAVGAPMLACTRCPLWPGFKRPARATAKPDPVLAAYAPTDEAALMAEFTSPAAIDLPARVAELADHDPAGPCPYWERVEEARAARIVIQCQQRTERDPASVAAEGWERVTMFTDENAMGVLNPRITLGADDFDTVAEVLAAAVGNARSRKRQHRSHRAWRQAEELVDWVDALGQVARSLASWAREQEGHGPRRVLELPALELPAGLRPAGGATAVLRLLAREAVPDAYRPQAFDVVRMAATGEHHNTRLLVAEGVAGSWHASFHRSWVLELPPEVCHVCLDATVYVDGLRRVRPDAVVLEPPGAAPRVHEARQWWQEINGRTSPAVVVRWIERALDATGWERAALVLPLRHRRLLFPQTRPRGNRPPVDKPVDVAALAAWGGPATAGTLERRLEAATNLAARIDELRQRLARDEHGNCLVEHHRGARSRGSNAFMADRGVDGLVVIGHQRTNPVDIAGAMLAAGQVAEVVAGSSWGDVEGELPHVDGTTRQVRWRGYACPVWAGMARALNRADLEQVTQRARPNLATGVPVLVVAAEPCGLPLADPPLEVPATVVAVVAAVRELTTGTPTGGKVGKLRHRHKDASIGQRSIEHTRLYLYRDLADRTAGAALGAIAARLGTPERSVCRALGQAVALGLLTRDGTHRWTRYRVVDEPVPPAAGGPPP